MDNKGGRPRKFSRRPTINCNDLAAVWGCTHRSVVNLWHRGELEGFRFGNRGGYGDLKIYEESAADYERRNSKDAA